MVHAGRTHVTWMSVVIMVIVTTSCITWLIVLRENKPRGRIIKDISEADIVRVPESTAHSLFKVNTTFTKDKHLAWVKESGKDHGNVFLDDSKMWITVGKQGVYLVYVQLTYSLKKDANSSRVDLMLYVEFNYTDGTEEYTAAFDTRQLTEKETDAHLSAFLLLDMEAGNRFSITAHPKEMIKYNDIRPFSSYITIIRYADLQD